MICKVAKMWVFQFHLRMTKVTPMTQNMTIMVCVKARLFQKHQMSQASIADAVCAPRACHMLSAKLLCEIIQNSNSRMWKRRTSFSSCYCFCDWSKLRFLLPIWSLINPLIAGDADAGCKIHPEQTLKANTLAVIINIVTWPLVPPRV